jgi:hypothetical protein
MKQEPKPAPHHHHVERRQRASASRDFGRHCYTNLVDNTHHLKLCLRHHAVAGCRTRMEHIVVCRCHGFVVTWGAAQHQRQKRAREKPPPVICLLLTGSRRCGGQARPELESRPIATDRVIGSIPARVRTASLNVASAKEFRDGSPYQHGATAISSGKLSTHS